MQFSTLTWGIISVFGGCLLQFTMGAFYSFGNMMTYMVSYMRYHGYSPSMTYTDFMIVQSTWGMTQGVIMPFSGFIISVIGEKCAMVSGAALFSAGCALTYITINKELWMVAGTYGFISAFGQNIALIPTLTTGMRWFPNNKGTVMGIVVGGFGGGAMIFNYIQSQIVNPYNVQPVGGDGEEKYFLDEEVLSRVPDLLWMLSIIYLILGVTGALLVVQPSKEWTEKQLEPCINPHGTEFDPVNTSSDNHNELVDLKDIDTDNDRVMQNEVFLSLKETDNDTDTVSVTWKQAFRTKELYLLWITRLSIVLISQVIAGLYKAFGTTFINDDSFLVLVGSISAIFNCCGRVFYGCIMDRFSYRIAMSTESILLTLLVSTFYVTSMIDPGSSAHEDCFSRNQSKPSYVNNTNLGSGVYASISPSVNISLSLENFEIRPSKIKIAPEYHHNNISEYEQTAPTNIKDDTPNGSLCQKSETSMLTKVMYAIWVWAIFLTFPGTYAMQPAVTAQTFGNKDSGTIYAFLFSSDIINNLIVATLSDGLVTRFGYLGLFLFVSAWGIIALVATLFYPKVPKPLKTLNGRIVLTN